MKEELQDCIRLRLGDANEAARETRIDVDALPTRHGVNPDDRMDGLDFLTTHMCPCGT